MEAAARAAAVSAARSDPRSIQNIIYDDIKKF
jgi:hypothetical protein